MSGTIASAAPQLAGCAARKRRSQSGSTVAVEQPGDWFMFSCMTMVTLLLAPVLNRCRAKKKCLA
jgi:hypothetical protein